MPAAKPEFDNRQLTSALIELIIKLPEHEQETLLRVLQAHHPNSDQSVPQSACERSGDYASGRYFYWDLFSA
jgi:hypothetical protein